MWHQGNGCSLAGRLWGNEAAQSGRTTRSLVALSADGVPLPPSEATGDASQP
jgi:hypothetical protein